MCLNIIPLILIENMCIINYLNIFLEKSCFL